MLIGLLSRTLPITSQIALPIPHIFGSYFNIKNVKLVIALSTGVFLARLLKKIIQEEKNDFFWVYARN